MEETIRPEHRRTIVSKPALFGFITIGASGARRLTRPLSSISLLLKTSTEDKHMYRPSRNQSWKDYPRIIGTYTERIRLLQLTERVWELLPQLHHDVQFDHEAFAHITVGFLREKGNSSKLMGLCSSSNPKRGHRVKHSERHGINRILIQRSQCSQTP